MEEREEALVARFRYRTSRSSGHFQTSASDGARKAAPAPPSSFAAPQPAAPAAPARAPQPQPQRPRPPARRTGLGVVTPQTTDTWRELLAPDGTPPALPFQIEYVRAAVWQQTGLRPSLRGLTIGQAQRILAALRVDPRPLWHSGRDNWAMNVLAICGRWLGIAALFMLILGVGRADGVPFVLLIIAAIGFSVARRQRRQIFEERHYRRARSAARSPSRDPLPERAEPPALKPGQEWHGPPPSGGDPYDVDTYLRRLGEEGR
ncbi:hypothetical protein SPF06_20200 [Sinomonas sp. JGH33]|uniref:DUF3040 domain-containing protein n=1 Tax=Sinomonas terricola TaxID=3110330 RepID=A0ABU5TBH9_9MICC|nr:hypothetical protein [Sinomonas sp. JGH33]MEA5457053.1 hypothetical protein [Sinomonas sp. JGH33]